MFKNKTGTANSLFTFYPFIAQYQSFSYFNMSFLDNEPDPAMDYVNSIVNGTDNAHNLDVMAV